MPHGLARIFTWAHNSGIGQLFVRDCNGMKGFQPTRLAIEALPDTMTCGPAGLHEIFRHLSDKVGSCAS